MKKIVMADALVGNDYSFYLCHFLKKAGVNIELVVTEDRESDIPLNFPLLRWMPSKNPAVGKLKKSADYFKYLLKLFLYLKNTAPALIHFQFFRRPRVEAIFLFFIKILPSKIVCTVHDILPPETRGIDAYFVKLVYRLADRLIVHSNYIREQLIRGFDLPGGKVFVAPHGDFDFSLPEKPLTPVEARSKLGFKADDFIFLFFGYIREYKGVDLLLAAAEKAISQNKRIKIIIAGSVHPPELLQKYQRIVQCFPRPGNLHFNPGFIPGDQVADYFYAADMLVLPYRNIYHSGVLHLAYSFGLPVIATRVGDFPESIEDQKSGFLIKPDDVDELADALISAENQREKVGRMGKYARHLSESKYSWKNAAEITRKVYQI